MAYPQHWRLRFEGEFLGTNNVVLEQWSNTINFLHADASAVDEDAFLETYAVPAAETIYSQSYISQSVLLTSIKFNEIDEAGHYADPNTTHQLTEDDFSPIRGTGTTYVEPQRALAVSFLTDARRGPAHRGRIFLPGFSGNVDNTLSISSTQATAIADNLTIALGGLDNVPALVPAIVSKIGQGVARQITSVAVGSRVDTIRRRRNRLTEVYATALI